MYKRINSAIIGGFPINGESLVFLQESFRDAFAALAVYFGDFVILSGVADLGANYGDGWMAINGELLPFVGGTKASNVVITETAVGKLFADGNSKNVWFTRTASCASSGGTPFVNFTRLSTAKADQISVAGKANKSQPAWINIPLINGWTGTAKYRFDEFGKVNLSINILRLGAGNVLFAAPIPAIIPASGQFECLSCCYTNGGPTPVDNQFICNSTGLQVGFASAGISTKVIVNDDYWLD